MMSLIKMCNRLTNWFYLILVFLFFVFIQSAQAQIPANFSYQGVLKDANGLPLNEAHDLTFRLYDVETGGSYIWQEDQHGIDVQDGIFNVILGDTSSLSSIAFDKQYWLGISINEGVELSPRTKLTSVPYAIMTSGGGGLTLPYNGTYNGNLEAFVLSNNGTGGAFQIYNGSTADWGMYLSNNNDNDALIISNSGTGRSLSVVNSGVGGGGNSLATFEILDPNNNDDVIYATTNGNGYAGYFDGNVHVTGALSAANVGITYNGVLEAFRIDNNGTGGGFFLGNSSTADWGMYLSNNNDNDALIVSNSGTGRSLSVTNDGVGGDGSPMAYFHILNPNNNDPVIYATTNGNGYAGYFDGNVQVNGDLSVSGSKPFVIDHPLDPENKILRHSSVESPERVNIYKGRAMLVGGVAVVNLPNYFDALNSSEGREVNLTPVNGWSPLYLVSKIANNQFTVKTTKDGNQSQEFSWVIYGVRNDKYAQDNPFVVEEEKGDNNNNFKKGELINPDDVKARLISESKNKYRNTQER